MQQTSLSISEIDEKGKIGIAYLKRIWSHAILEKGGSSSAKHLTHHNYVSAVFDALGIGMEPTYQFLFTESPSFEAFEDWIVANGNISNELIVLFNAAIQDDGHHHGLEGNKVRILDEVSLRKWDQDGYVIIKMPFLKRIVRLH
ncbi:MAG: hypothetical protein JKY54_12020 [Flavobacteriales bacterium]|nr:hypothetical protein [Flavobacteriales bacterium]